MVQKCKTTVKILKFGTPQTIAIIVLKTEKFDVEKFDVLKIEKFDVTLH